MEQSSIWFVKLNDQAATGNEAYNEVGVPVGVGGLPGQKARSESIDMSQSYDPNSSPSFYQVSASFRSPN